MVSVELFVCASILIIITSLYPGVTVAEDSPSEAEIKKRCGFTPNEIFECKRQLCLNASVVCAGKSEQTGIECQAEVCAKARRTCEKPLNQRLSKFEVCLADKMILVDKNCFLENMSHIQECTYEGYNRVESKCFKDSWKMKFMEELLVQESEADCAVEKCYENTVKCFQSLLHDQVEHPGLHRKFDVAHCTYVQDETYSCHDTHCFSELKDCRPQVSHAGLIVFLVLSAVFGVVGLAFYLKRRGQTVPYEQQHNHAGV